MSDLKPVKRPKKLKKFKHDPSSYKGILPENFDPFEEFLNFPEKGKSSKGWVPRKIPNSEIQKFVPVKFKPVMQMTPADYWTAKTNVTLAKDYNKQVKNPSQNFDLLVNYRVKELVDNLNNKPIKKPKAKPKAKPKKKSKAKAK